MDGDDYDADHNEDISQPTLGMIHPLVVPVSVTALLNVIVSSIPTVVVVVVVVV